MLPASVWTQEDSLWSSLLLLFHSSFLPHSSLFWPALHCLCGREKNCPVMLPRQLSALLFPAARVLGRARAVSQALGLFLLSLNAHLHPHQTLLHMTQSLCLATCKLETCPLGYSGKGSMKNILLASRAANPMNYSPAGANRQFSVQVAQPHPQCLQEPFDLESKPVLRAAHSQPWPGHFPGLLQMLGWLAVPSLPEARVPSRTCFSQSIAESTKLLCSVGPPVKICIPDNPTPHGHVTSCLFPHFPVPSPVWSKYGKGSLTRISVSSLSLTHPWQGYMGKLWCWQMKTYRYVPWPNKCLCPLCQAENMGGVGRVCVCVRACAASSCTSAFPIPYCLSRYCRRRQEQGDSFQKIPLSLPCHCSGHWNSIWLLRLNRKSVFITE